MRADRSRALFAALALAVGAVSCEMPTIAVAGPGSDLYAGYDPTSNTGLIYHWSAGHNIGIYVDRAEAPSDADLASAVNAAIAAWEPVARLGEVRMRVVPDVRDADVIFRHSQAPSLVSGGVCEPFYLGSGNATSFCVPDRTPLRLDLKDGTGGHVLMEVAVNRFVLDTVSFFPALVAHEMGHVLGIGAHSTSAADLMTSRPRVFRPTDADAATLRYVLSQRPDVRF